MKWTFLFEELIIDKNIEEINYINPLGKEEKFADKWMD